LLYFVAVLFTKAGTYAGHKSLLTMSRFRYHAFISHVFEDKATIADPLNDSLRRSGFTIWYSGSDLRPGDNLSHKIHRVIPQCKYAIVILSPDYFKSAWAKEELRIISALEHDGSRIILPVWHNITSSDVKETLPFHLERFALRSSEGIDTMLPALVAELKRRKPAIKTKARQSTRQQQDNPANAVNDSGMIINGTHITIQPTGHFSGRDIHINTTTSSNNQHDGK
jgi:hypothetical protein